MAIFQPLERLKSQSRIIWFAIQSLFFWGVSLAVPFSIALGQLSSSAEREPAVRFESTNIRRSKFPVVDTHTHFFIKGRHDLEALDQYVAMMDQNNIAVSVSLDGTLGTRLDQHIDFLWNKYKDRFVVFANIDFRGSGNVDDPATWDCNQDGFVRRTVELLRQANHTGKIAGLKFFKDFGLRYRGSDGQLLKIDDERWDPIWLECSRLGIPVLMHTADPSAFFRPADPNNERMGELQNHPDWSFFGPEYPSRDSLHQARNRVIARHKDTVFIGAHFANDAEDLHELGMWLDQYPNLFVEFSSRLNELGRQPFSSKRFFEQYQDRILFGTDGPWPEERLRIYWRFLESDDEYFHYSEKRPPPQGDWRIYALSLSDTVLEKIYSKNAARIIPGIQQRLDSLATQSR